jgi:hypothetical protein
MTRSGLPVPAALASLRAAGQIRATGFRPAPLSGLSTTDVHAAATPQGAPVVPRGAPRRPTTALVLLPAPDPPPSGSRSPLTAEAGARAGIRLRLCSTDLRWGKGRWVGVGRDERARLHTTRGYLPRAGPGRAPGREGGGRPGRARAGRGAGTGRGGGGPIGWTLGGGLPPRPLAHRPPLPWSPPRLPTNPF